MVRSPRPAPPLQAAEQSIVLVQNAPSKSVANHLPLKKGLKLAVIGPNGNSTAVYQGQYQGPSCPDAPEDEGYTGCLPSALSAIRAANAGGEVTFVNGCVGGQACTALADPSLVKAAVAAADVVLLVLGEAIGVTNSEGRDRSSYALTGMQTQLAQQVGAMAKPVVVILLSGGAVGMDWIAGQKAWPIMIPGYGGIFAPHAIARTLFGEAAPSGLLPYTVYPSSWDAGCYTKGAGDPL